MSEEIEKREERGIIFWNNEPPYYGWYKDGCDAFLNLGEMEKAVVIRFALGSSVYFISEGSYYPFKKEVYESRFTSIQDAREFASKAIGDWFVESVKQIGI